MKIESVLLSDREIQSHMLAQAANYPFSFIRCFSEVLLGANTAQLDTENLLEARFFGLEGELRIYRDGDMLKAVTLSEEDGDETLDERYRIANPRFGRELTIRKILAFDEDGQAYVRATRLMDWRK